MLLLTFSFLSNSDMVSMDSHHKVEGTNSVISSIKIIEAGGMEAIATKLQTDLKVSVYFKSSQT